MTRPSLVVAALLPLAVVGCFGPGYEPGWRIVDRQRDCSECEEVVFRVDTLTTAWTGRIEAGHDLWGTYAHPDADASRIVANWTVSRWEQPMAIEFGGRLFTCGFTGGNVTNEKGSFDVRVAGPAIWRATITPGQGTCTAELEWSDGWSGTIVSWFLPEGSDGASAPIDVAFTVRDQAPTAQDS